MGGAADYEKTAVALASFYLRRPKI